MHEKSFKSRPLTLELSIHLVENLLIIGKILSIYTKHAIINKEQHLRDQRLFWKHILLGKSSNSPVEWSIHMYITELWWKFCSLVDAKHSFVARLYIRRHTSLKISYK